MTKDYYKILGIGKTATKEEVKKAFRELAHKHHPDKGGDAARFKEASEAYQVLSDDKKRAEYDAYGRVFEGAPGGGPSEGFDFSQGFNGLNFDIGGLNEIFSEFFGGTAARGGRVRRGGDISIEIQIPFEEAFFGSERKVLLVKSSLCDACGGTGGQGRETKTCPKCQGKGTIHETKRAFFGTFASTQACEECGGSGKVPVKKCGPCRGSGVLRRQEEIKIAIPAGIENGEIIRMSGMGEAISFGSPGDLYVKVGVLSHPVFRKVGNNLAMDLNIKLTDAILGKEMTLATFDGPVEIKIPAGTAHGEVLTVRGRGVPSGRGRGDLLIKLAMVLPKKLSREAKNLIEKLREEGI
ncbi:MAG TPA: DnaJ C-terminal domain-containing protein [Candidatus Paceibacterota bacterium]|nr:DnaJ C-terminal domain-containing protein [Candidatus Paceibacterota bacterium]